MDQRLAVVEDATAKRLEAVSSTSAISYTDQVVLAFCISISQSFRIPMIQNGFLMIYECFCILSERLEETIAWNGLPEGV